MDDENVRFVAALERGPLRLSYIAESAGLELELAGNVARRMKRAGRVKFSAGKWELVQ